MLTKAFLEGKGKEIMTERNIELLADMIKTACLIKDVKKLTRKEVEITYLCGVLIPFLKEEFRLVKGLKENIITLCWFFIKSDDVIFKNIGYLSTCKFINTFGMPPEQIS